MTMIIRTPVVAALSALAAIVGTPAAASPHVPAAELQAQILGVSVVWVDGDEACPGIESVGCYIPGRGAQITLATDLLEYSRGAVLDVVRHEAAHYWIDATCGTPEPPITMTESGDRSENVADAYATRYFGMGKTGYYGYTDEDTAIATAIREEELCEVVPDEPQDPASVSVHRFWSPRFDNAHFFTMSEAEADEIRRTDPNWTYEGVAFQAYAPRRAEACPDDTAPVYRFYSDAFETHFLTIDGTEARTVRETDENWTYEGVAFCELTTSAAGTQPVYRFYSDVFEKHFFTVDEHEMTQLRDHDDNWIYEGVAWYAPTAQADTTDSGKEF
jgi:hypothetical protein